MERVPLLRYYHVFNVAQCDGLNEVPTEIAPDVKPAAEIVANYPSPAPEIRHGMARAFYSPVNDSIGIPNMERFDQPADYFMTLFHELIHSTGAKSRLNRPAFQDPTRFGSEPYSKEELVAEMGAAFLSAHAGIEARTLDNTAAYIESWLKALSDDKRLIVLAAAQAEKAADFMLHGIDETSRKEQEVAPG
jgi:antirestriction protein ArdC